MASIRGWLWRRSKAARAPGCGGRSRKLRHLAVAHHVVEDDHRAGPAELDGPIQVVRIVGLVGVDEDEVERPLGSSEQIEAAPEWISTLSISPARAMFRGPPRRACRHIRGVMSWPSPAAPWPSRWWSSPRACRLEDSRAPEIDEEVEELALGGDTSIAGRPPRRWREGPPRRQGRHRPADSDAM